MLAVVSLVTSKWYNGWKTLIHSVHCLLPQNSLKIQQANFASNSFQNNTPVLRSIYVHHMDSICNSIVWSNSNCSEISKSFSVAAGSLYMLSKWPLMISNSPDNIRSKRVNFNEISFTYLGNVLEPRVQFWWRQANHMPRTSPIFSTHIRWATYTQTVSRTICFF